MKKILALALAATTAFSMFGSSLPLLPLTTWMKLRF